MLELESLDMINGRRACVNGIGKDVVGAFGHETITSRAHLGSG